MGGKEDLFRRYLCREPRQVNENAMSFRLVGRRETIEIAQSVSELGESLGLKHPPPIEKGVHVHKVGRPLGTHEELSRASHYIGVPF